MTKNNKAQKSEYVIYYFHMHTTTINSNELTKSGYKKKISKCNSPIFIINIKINIVYCSIIHQVNIKSKIHLTDDKKIIMSLFRSRYI